MDKIVFILGLPGSGKSAAARYLQQLAKDKWNVCHFNDYKYLLKMAKSDKEGLCFSSTKGHQGFDVHDLKVFDEALEILRDRVQRPLSMLMRVINKLWKKDNLILIEFSRDDYCQALEFFKPLDLSQNTFFLFVDANISACKQRIKSRVKNPQTPDDYYVSEYIFEVYYQRDRRDYLHSTANYLEQQFDIQSGQIHVVKNSQFQSLSAFQEKVKSAILPFLDERAVKYPVGMNAPSPTIQKKVSLRQHKVGYAHARSDT